MGSLDNLAGQLAWTEEPTGGADLGYDAFRRASFARRRIDDRVSEATTHFAPSGLPLDRSYDDGFSYTYTHDPAARLTGIGDLWTVLLMDAAGSILHERTQNGVDTTYARDVLGLVTQVTVRDVDGVAIYDVSATRNLANEILTETDRDNRGLDHSATFTYDGFARLTGATIDGGTRYAFGYSYDVLHNMTSRTGPATLHAMFGTYHYGRGPRQLTSITDASGAVTHTFDFDAAGRQIAEDALRMTFDASDRITRVTGLPAGAVTHAYGVDGQRVKTVEPNSVQYFFGDGTSERNGVREHAGDRVIARVAVSTTDGGDGPGGPGGGGAGLLDPRSWSPGAIAFCACALALAFAIARSRRRRVLALAALAIVIAPGCSTARLGERASATTVPVPTFIVTYDSSAADTIRSVVRMAGDTPIRRLMIADHGTRGVQLLGWESMLDATTAKPAVDAALLPLAGKFTRDGVLVLGGCNIMNDDSGGQISAGLRHLSKTLQVEVRAGTGEKSVYSDEIDWETTACRGDRCVKASNEAGIAEAWKKQEGS
jgi:YD repeat-containing protein